MRKVNETQKRLEALQRRSATAIDLVTSTVNNLEAVNEEIDVVVADIEAQKSELEATQSSLRETQNNNGKIISNFKALIGR